MSAYNHFPRHFCNNLISLSKSDNKIYLYFNYKNYMINIKITKIYTDVMKKHEIKINGMNRAGIRRV